MSDAENEETLDPGKDVADVSPSTEADDPKRKMELEVRKSEDSLAPTSHGETRHVAQQIALEENLALTKNIRVNMKDDIYRISKDSKKAPVDPIVKICWALAALAVVCLIGFICYSLLRTQSHDENLEDRIMSGDKAASLRALKQQSVQNYFTIFVIVIVMLIIVMSVGFGYLIYFKDTEKHEADRKEVMVRCAGKAVDECGDVVSSLTSDMKVQSFQISTMERDVDVYSAKINELSKKEDKNQEEIKELMQQKAEKQAELAEAQACLKAKEENLVEAKIREEGLHENMKGMQETNKKMHQEAAVNTSRMSRLQDDLRQEQSEASSLRSRARSLENSQQEYRSKAHQLEVDKARLTEAANRKPTVVIERRWWPFW